MHERKRGFTLIEVMIAMAIMIIGLLAFWKMHAASVAGDAFSNEMTKAIFYAQEKVERLRAMDFDSITSGEDSVTDVITYRIKWTVSNYSSLSDAKQLTVEVGWRCGSNIDSCKHKIEIDTIIAKL